MGSFNLANISGTASNLYTTNLFWDSATTLNFTPSFTPTLADPLAREGQLRPETPEAWLRRRVREVQWKAA